MNKEKRIEYLNALIKNSDNFSYNGPPILCKYRPFDKYTFEMLEQNYLFLCKASRLDDETECDTTIDLSNYCDYKTNNLKMLCMEHIIQTLKPYCSEETYEDVRAKIYQISRDDGTIQNNLLLELSLDLQEVFPKEIVVQLVNNLANIPEKLDNPAFKTKLETFINFALIAKEAIGVCSLSEDNDNQYLWEKYADNNSGYCVEYDMNSFELYKFLFPVIYDADRQTNIAISVIDSFIAQFVAAASNNQIQTDMSQFLRLFISKYPKWEYQNEWRILGNADTHCPAPKIKRIIIGENATEENSQLLKDYCENHGIECVYRQQ